MARKSEQQLADIHNEAIIEFGKIESALRNERLQSLKDRRFYSIAGAQWEGALGEQFENKPKFEVNKIHLSVIRIINEYRNNKIDAIFTPKDGMKNDKLSDTCNGLYRADENASCADEAYDNGFEEAIGGGFGAWRIRCDYEDEDGWDDEENPQNIRIEPIYDADSSVYFDLEAKRQDKSDAKRCFVISSMTYEAYHAEYGDNPASWPKLIHQFEFDWLTPSVVYVAEYYRVEKVTEKVHIFKGLLGDEIQVTDDELEDDDEKLDKLKATGYHETRIRKRKVTKVAMYLMNGSKIIEDCGYIPGRNIPIIPVYAKRWFVDNVERCMGHVRLATDTQRLINMLRSKLGEMASLSSVEIPIFTPEQMLGHGTKWSEANIKNYPYMLINAMQDQNGTAVAAGPVGYTKVANLPPAIAALMQVVEQDMIDLLGNQQAGEQLNSNISGVAVDLIQAKLDMQTYIYISNFAKAKARSAKVWLSMAKDVFTEKGRKLKSLTSQGETDTVELMKQTVNDDGQMVIENDLTSANFDVNFDIGPTSSSRRSSTVRSLTQMLSITQDPETQQVLGAMIMMNMEGEGISDVRDYFRKKLVNMGVIQPTAEERQQMQQNAANQPPDPNAEFLKASADQADAEAAKDRANTILITANAEKVNAETDKIKQDLHSQNHNDLLKTISLHNEITKTS